MMRESFMVRERFLRHGIIMGYAAFIASSCSTATQRAVKCSGFPASIDSAGVAQLVEQRIRNAKVVGSTLSPAPIAPNARLSQSISRSHPCPLMQTQAIERARSQSIERAFANATGANGSTRLGLKNEAARHAPKAVRRKAAGQPRAFKGRLRLRPTACTSMCFASSRITARHPACACGPA